MKNKNKNILRSKYLLKRKSFNKKELAIKSHLIVKILYKTIKKLKFKKICCYQAINNEVNLNIIYKKLLAQNIDIYFPKIIKNTIKLVKIDNLEKDFKRGFKNIKEPINNKFTDPKEIDCFLVPGVLFDKLGNRIGYGKAYYDKLLSDLKTYKIGIAYKFQVLEKIDVEEWDIKMDKVLSEGASSLT